MNTAESNLIKILKDKVRFNPGSPLFLSLAEEFKKQGNIENAIDALTEGLKHNPQFLTARLRLARWYAECNMPAEALREIEKVLLVRKDNISAHRLAFRIALEVGDKEKAISQAKAMLSLIPNDKEAKNYLKDNEQQDVCAKDIIEITKESNVVSPPITEAPSSQALHRDLRQIEILVQQGRFKEASLLCDVVLSDYPKDRKALQKKEEIRSLLTMLRRKKEKVIEKLKTLQDAFTFRIFKVIK